MMCMSESMRADNASDQRVAKGNIDMSENVDRDSVGSHCSAASGRKWVRDEVSKQMRTSPTFGMLADLEAIAEPFFLGINSDEDDSDFDEGPF